MYRFTLIAAGGENKTDAKGIIARKLRADKLSLSQVIVPA